MFPEIQPSIEWTIQRYYLARTIPQPAGWGTTSSNTLIRGKNSEI